MTILRQHTSKSKFYFLISRNAFVAGQDGLVDINIQLPGVLKKIKFMFFPKGEYTKQEDQKFLIGNKAEIIQDTELRKYCDIFYE